MQDAASNGPLSEEQRRARNQQVFGEFERNRDAAELLSAKSRFAQGDLIGAKADVQRLLQRQAEHHEARLLLAEIELTAKQPAEAKKHVEQVLQKQPDDAQAVHTLGLVCDAEGDAGQAAVHYQRAAQLDPKSEVYAASYSIASRGPTAPPAGIATAESRSTASVDAARTGRAGSSERAEEKDPLRDVELAILEQSPQKAWREYQRLRGQRRDDPQIPLGTAVLALRHNQSDLAVSILEEAKPRFPKNATVSRSLGAAYYRSGDFRAAQTALSEAIALDKSCALSYLLMGCTLSKLGQSAAAEDYFRQAQMLDPRYTARR